MSTLQPNTLVCILSEQLYLAARLHVSCLTFEELSSKENCHLCRNQPRLRQRWAANEFLVIFSEQTLSFCKILIFFNSLHNRSPSQNHSLLITWPIFNTNIFTSCLTAISAQNNLQVSCLVSYSVAYLWWCLTRDFYAMKEDKKMLPYYGYLRYQILPKIKSVLVSHSLLYEVAIFKVHFITASELPKVFHFQLWISTNRS